MTIDELKAKCEEAVKDPHISLGFVILKMLNRFPSGEKMYLVPPRHGPLGKVVNVNNEGTTCFFKAQAVLAYLKRCGQ